MLARQSYVKYNALMLVQGNVGRVKKLGVVIRKNGRDLDITLRNYNSLSPFVRPEPIWSRLNLSWHIFMAS